MTLRVIEQFTTSSPRYNNEDKGRGGVEIKAIDFLVSGSESIELLFRSLPSLVDRGIYLNDKGGRQGFVLLIRMGYFSVGVVV